MFNGVDIPFVHTKLSINCLLNAACSELVKKSHFTRARKHNSDGGCHFLYGRATRGTMTSNCSEFITLVRTLTAQTPGEGKALHLPGIIVFILVVKGFCYFCFAFLGFFSFFVFSSVFFFLFLFVFFRSAVF